MTWSVIHLAVLVATMLLSWLFTHICRSLAMRWGYLDRPLSEAHKAHREPIPVLGGLAMCVAWNLVILGGLLVPLLAGSHLSAEVQPYLPGVKVAFPRLLAIALGGIVMMFMGMRDDRRAMKAGPKFLLQFVVAAAIACEVRISCFHAVPGLNWAVTVLWIMTVVNALNFFDNMDGLAGGTAAIAAAFFLAIALLRGQMFVALLSAATCGTALGFLMLNRPPAKIFMGDGGSHFLGYNLALAGIMTTFYQTGESLTSAPVLIPVLVLSLPLFDAVAVVCIRLHEHRPIYIGDNRHISHRFVHLGLTRPQAVFLICLLNIIQGTGALTLVWLPPLGSALVFLQAIAIFLVIFIIQFTVPEKQS